MRTAVEGLSTACRPREGPDPRSARPGLDEPTIGLDPRQIHEIRGLIHHLSGNRRWCSRPHILPEVSQICDKVVIIADGCVVLEEYLKKLPAGTSLEGFSLNAITQERHDDGATSEETLEEVGAGDT